MKRCYKLYLLFLMLLTFSLHAISQTNTIILRPGPADGKGAELSTYSPSVNAGTSVSFDANAWTVDGIPILIRSLIQFDLSSIPSGATILSATLSLYCNPGSSHYQLNSGDNQSLLLRVNEAWNDNLVTWDNQPGVIMNNPVLIPTSTSMTQNYPDIDVTVHVQDMVNDPAHNFGWQIRLITEELYRSMQLSSCHDAEQYRPKLTIRYKSCNMPVAAWNYSLATETVNFADASSASVFSWFWDFGDGYSSSLQNPVHRYAAYGNYRVCLKATDSCGTETHCDTVRYCPSMNTSFSFLVDNFSGTFSDLSNNASQWFWSFGDGFYSDLQNPLHVFNSAGTYYVCLTARDNCSAETYCDSVSVVPNGVQEIANNDFQIYPVPAKDKLFLLARNATSKIVSVAIISMTGVVVCENVPVILHSDEKAQIDLSNLPPGNYILKLILNNKVTVSKFIIGN